MIIRSKIWYKVGFIFLIFYVAGANPAGTQVVVGNGAQGCNTTLNIPATSIPTSVTSVAVDNNGNIIYGEQGACANGKVGKKDAISGNQVVSITNINPIDVAHAADGTNDAFILASDYKIYEISGNSAVYIGQAVPSTKLKISSTGAAIVIAPNGDLKFAGGGNFLSNLNVQDFDYKDGVAAMITPTGLYSWSLGGGLQLESNEVTNGKLIGLDMDNYRVTVQTYDGQMLVYDGDAEEWLNLGVNANWLDMEQENGVAYGTDGTVVEMVNTQGGVLYCASVVFYPDNQCAFNGGKLKGIAESQCITLDTISFSSALNGVTQTFVCDVQINDNLVIIGNGIDSTILSGTNWTRIFHIYPGYSLTLENMTLENANENTNGGAILNEGTLILKNVRFRNNFEGANRKAMTNLNNLIIGPGTTIIQE